MKKMLLIPLIATSLSLLAGCQEKPTVSLKQWLTDIEEDSFTYFSVRDREGKYQKSSYRDYQYKVADIIKSNISSISLKKTTPNVKGDHFIYTIDRQIGNYNSLFLMVYENCLIMSARGEKNGERIDQYAEYAISEKESKAMREAVVKRFEEMDEIYIAAYKKGQEETTLDNYYQALNKSKDSVAVRYDDKEVKDSSLSLLDDIKAFDFAETAKEYTIDYTNRVGYGVRDDYSMEIGTASNDGVVKLYYYFDNPANPFVDVYKSTCVKTYLVSKDKVTAFLEKAKAL